MSKSRLKGGARARPVLARLETRFEVSTFAGGAGGASSEGGHTRQRAAPHACARNEMYATRAPSLFSATAGADVRLLDFVGSPPEQSSRMRLGAVPVATRLRYA